MLAKSTLTNLALKQIVSSKSVPDDSASNQTLTRSKQQFMYASQCLFCGQLKRTRKGQYRYILFELFIFKTIS